MPLETRENVLLLLLLLIGFVLLNLVPGQKVADNQDNDGYEKKGDRDPWLDPSGFGVVQYCHADVPDGNY